jgi:hypothetical protein
MNYEFRRNIADIADIAGIAGIAGEHVGKVWCARLARRRIVDEHMGLSGPNAGGQASLGASPGQGRPRHTEVAEFVSS